VPAARWDNTGTHYSKRRKVKNTLSHRTQVDENTWTWQRLGALRIPPQQGPYSSECKGRHAQLDCGTWCQPRLGAEAHTDKPLPWPYRTPPLKLATCTLHSEAIVCLSWTTTRPVRSALRSLICRCRVALWVWLRNQIKRSEGPDTCLVSGLLTARVHLDRTDRLCLVCKSLDCVEDEQHFVFDCPAYSHIRSQHLDLLQHCCTIADFMIFCEPNACGGFLRECFACRKQMLSV